MHATSPCARVSTVYPCIRLSVYPCAGRTWSVKRVSVRCTGAVPLFFFDTFEVLFLLINCPLIRCTSHPPPCACSLCCPHHTPGAYSCTTRYAPLQNYICFLPYLQRLFLNDVPLPRSLSLPRGLVTQSTSGRFAALSQHFPVPVLLLPLRPSESCGPVPTHLPTNPKM